MPLIKNMKLDTSVPAESSSTQPSTQKTGKLSRAKFLKDDAQSKVGTAAPSAIGNRKAFEQTDSHLTSGQILPAEKPSRHLHEKPKATGVTHSGKTGKFNWHENLPNESGQVSDMTRAHFEKYFDHTKPDAFEDLSKLSFFDYAKKHWTQTEILNTIQGLQRQLNHPKVKLDSIGLARVQQSLEAYKTLI